MFAAITLNIFYKTLGPFPFSCWWRQKKISQNMFSVPKGKMQHKETSGIGQMSVFSKKYFHVHYERTWKNPQKHQTPLFNSLSTHQSKWRTSFLPCLLNGQVNDHFPFERSGPLLCRTKVFYSSYSFLHTFRVEWVWGNEKGWLLRAWGWPPCYFYGVSSWEAKQITLQLADAMLISFWGYK